LDPFNRGGGMIMDPRDLFRPPRNDRFPGGPRFPPGSVPPGARFDPFGPPGVGPSPFGPSRGGFSGVPPAPRTFGEPNPDHMRRPDFYDDMFM
jgi:proteasome inhibitor subunit 1 (PI31)